MVYMPGSYSVFPLDLFVSKESLLSGSSSRVIDEYSKAISSGMSVIVHHGTIQVPVPPSALTLTDGLCEIQLAKFNGACVGAVVVRSRLTPAKLAQRTKSALSLTCDLEYNMSSRPPPLPNSLIVGVLQAAEVRTIANVARLNLTAVNPVHVDGTNLLYHNANTEPGDCGSPLFRGGKLYAIHVGSVKKNGIPVNIAMRLIPTFSKDPTQVSGNSLISHADDSDDDSADEENAVPTSTNPASHSTIQHEKALLGLGHLNSMLDLSASPQDKVYGHDTSDAVDGDVVFELESARSAFDVFAPLFSRLHDKASKLIFSSSPNSVITEAEAHRQLSLHKAATLLFRRSAAEALSRGDVIPALTDKVMGYIPPASKSNDDFVAVPVHCHALGQSAFDGTMDSRITELAKGCVPRRQDSASLQMCVNALGELISRVDETMVGNFIKVTDLIDPARLSDPARRHLYWLVYQHTATSGSPGGIQHLIEGAHGCRSKSDVLQFISQCTDAKAHITMLTNLADSAYRTLSAKNPDPRCVPVYVYSKDDDAYPDEKLLAGKHRNICQPAWPFSVIDWLMTCYVSSEGCNVTETSFTKALEEGKDLRLFFLDTVMGACRFSLSTLSSPNCWAFGGNVFTEVAAFASRLTSDSTTKSASPPSDCFCYDVSQWDRAVPARLAHELYIRLYKCAKIPDSITKKIATVFSGGVNGGGTFIFDGSAFNLRAGSFSWCSGANKTLSGNTLLHCAILRAAGFPVALTMGDDGVAILPHPSISSQRLIDFFASIGMTMKRGGVNDGTFDFCGMIVHPGSRRISVDINKIMRRRYCKLSYLTSSSSSGDMRNAVSQAYAAAKLDGWTLDWVKSEATPAAQEDIDAIIASLA